jgi:hypothetical protein
MTRARALNFVIAIASLVPLSAYAQQASVDTGSAQTQFGGTAGFACLVSTPQSGQITGASVSTVGGVAQVVFDPQTVIDPDTLIARAFSISLSVPVTCNGGHVVTVRSLRGGMQLQTPIAQAIGLSSRIDMDISALWLGDSGQITTSGRPISANISKNSAGSGLVEVTVNGRVGSDPLVAGRYSDEIIIDLVALQ